LVSKPDGASKEVIAAVIVIVRELTLNMTDFLKRTPLCIPNQEGQSPCIIYG